jgi:hypothetical protein
MFLAKPSLYGRSIEKSNALKVAAMWIAADSLAHSQLQRLVSPIRTTIHPNAIHKLLDDFPSTVWARLELGQCSIKPRQILSRNPVTTQDVPTDFSDHQRLGASKTHRTNRWELWWVQKVGGGMFARWPEVPTRSLRFGFFFQPGEFIH